MNCPCCCGGPCVAVPHQFQGWACGLCGATFIVTKSPSAVVNQAPAPVNAPCPPGTQPVQAWGCEFCHAMFPTSVPYILSNGLRFCSQTCEQAYAAVGSKPSSAVTPPAPLPPSNPPSAGINPWLKALGKAKDDDPGITEFDLLPDAD